MSIKLLAKLPKRAERNELDVPQLEHRLVNTVQPGATIAVMTLRTKSTEHDHEDGGDTVKLSIGSIEVLEGDDASAALDMLERARECRTGQEMFSDGEAPTSSRFDDEEATT